jgi:hypothetical protein
MKHTQQFVLWCQRIVLAILLIFPLSLALLYQISGIARFPSGFDVLVLAPLFFTLAGFLVYLFLRGEIKGDWMAIALVILLAVALRMAMSLILSTDLTSDVLDTHLFAQDILSGNITAHAGKYTYIPAATYLNMMGVTLAGLYALLGASVRTAKFFMVVLAGLTCGMVYKVGKDVSQDHRVGLAAAILFAVWPSLVCYTGIPTSEHIAICLLTLISLLWLSFFRSNKFEHWLWAIVMYASLGAMIGLVDWYRPVGIIVLLAMVLAEIFSREKRPKLLQHVAQIIALCLCYSIVSGLSLTITEKMHSKNLPSTGQMIGGALLIGTDVRNKGVHNWEDQGIIKDAYDQFPGDFNKANRYLLNLALERILKYRNQLPGLLKVKFERVWMNDDQQFYFSLIGSDDQELVADLKILNQFFLVMITGLVIISTIRSLIQPPQKQVFMMQLFILGLALLLLVTEAQTRYRTVLIPYLVILAAMGLKDGIAFVTRIFTKPVHNRD